MTLDEARGRIGAKVRYTAPQSPETRSRDGVITGVNDHFIFVRYAFQRRGAQGQATRPMDLEFIEAHK